MTHIVKNWWQKRQERLKQEDFSTAREVILFNLSNELTTEESINLFKDVRDVFTNKMQQRLVDVSQEKIALEQFLVETTSSV